MTSFGTAKLTRYEVLDADEIVPNLFQGSVPTQGKVLRELGVPYTGPVRCKPSAARLEVPRDRGDSCP